MFKDILCGIDEKIMIRVDDTLFQPIKSQFLAKKVNPRKTFQNLSKEKQERITRIAVEEFAYKGFEGASINSMVGRMKIAKGSIFQYFGDKKGLFLFVFNR